MDRLRDYIISHFTILFFSIFIPLVAIASIIFLIKLATYTAVIQVSLSDMGILYLFILPELLFYTLPVTFLISAALTLHRLSSDNEMVAIFSLGITPRFVLRTLRTPALLLSLLLLFDFFVMFPHATTLSTNFLRLKQSKAKFNLSASEFGHAFGDWLLYIGKDNKDQSYGDVFLFHKKGGEELLVGAQKATVENQSGVLTLRLQEGKGFAYTSEKLSQINFKEASINNLLTADLRTYRTPINFWLDPERREHKIKMFITDILLALFPVTSLYFIGAVGIVHDRHQKGHLYLSLFVVMLLYYAAVLGLLNLLRFYTIPVVLGLFVLFSYWLYHKKVAVRF